jgi:hypothetical protein
LDIEICPLATPAKLLEAVSPRDVVAVDALPSSTLIWEIDICPDAGVGMSSPYGVPYATTSARAVMSPVEDMERITVVPYLTTSFPDSCMILKFVVLSEPPVKEMEFEKVGVPEKDGVPEKTGLPEKVGAPESVGAPV